MREIIGVRWNKSRLERSSAKTPEPPMARPKVRLREGDVEAFRNVAHSVISRTLARECEFRRQGCPEPDVQEWKLVKRHKGLRVYKCKMQPAFQPSLSQENALARAPTAVCIGTIDGPNRDPFKQLALKWILAQNFGDMKCGNYHDVCSIESTGTGVDGGGQRFGYRLIKDVDLAEYPQMSTSNDVVRVRMTMCWIFRQEANSRTVRVYSKGMLDRGQEIPSFGPNSDATCTMMLSIASATEIAEAKRLTLLALQRAEYDACLSQRTCEAEDSCRETEATVTSPLPAQGSFDPRESFLQKMPSDPCSICIIASKRLRVDPRDPCFMLTV
ncbi:hypothetical protein PInf_008298 [Phytophthora infestans]|nr:hypothetical protein PInf_008298 [Phytophthora infestans]